MLLPGPGVRQQKCVGGASGVECCRGLGVSGARIRGGLRTGQPLRWAAVCASGGERTRRAAAGRRGTRGCAANVPIIIIIIIIIN